MSETLIPRLNTLLADLTVSYQRLRTYHWTVKGPMFFQLHERFEEMYNSSALWIDEIAERIVGLGGAPVGTLGGLLEIASLREDLQASDASSMVEHLIKDQSHLVSQLREINALAAESSDPLTANMVEEIADQAEKSAWMLEAYLG